MLLKRSEGRGQLGRFVFIGEHASWDRSPISGYSVAFAPFVDGEPVVAGVNSADCKQSYSAPGGVTQAPDCALIIAAAGVGNAIWRVTGSASKTSNDTASTAPVNAGAPG